MVGAGAPVRGDTGSSVGSAWNERLAVGCHGEVHVTSRVVGFKKIKFYTSENVGSGELDLPEQEMHTTAYWLTLARTFVERLPFAGNDRRDGVVGLGFAMRQVAQLLLMCDYHDIGLAIHGDPVPSLGRRPEEPVVGVGLNDPTIFVYDNYPGGIGFSEPLFRLHDRLLVSARALVERCPCDTGCPASVGPIGETGPRAKEVALGLLVSLLAKDPSLGESP